MKRSRLVALGALALLATASAAAKCDGGEDEYSQICVDESTSLRLDDEECERDGRSSHFVWFYGSSRHPAPAVGGAVDRSHFTTAKPAGKISTVSRGGFGGRVGSGGS